MKNIQIMLVILSFLVFNSLSNAQSRTNLELVDSLIHLSVNDLAKNVNNTDVSYLVFAASDDYSVLKSSVIKYLQNNDFELSENINEKQKLTYTLKEIKIGYSEIFRDGLFGNYLVERTAEIKSLYFMSNDLKIENSREFNYELKDSVLYSDIPRLDNIAYSFTSAELPEEPFFASTLEPAIALGTAAIAVYLFFNIRSK